MAIRLFGEPRLDTRGKNVVVRYMGMDMNIKQLVAKLPYAQESGDFYHTTDHAAEALEDLARQLRSL